VGSNPTPAALEEYPDSKQVGATGSPRTRTAVVTVPASKLGVESKGFVFTSGRNPRTGGQTSVTGCRMTTGRSGSSSRIRTRKRRCFPLSRPRPAHPLRGSKPASSPPSFDRCRGPTREAQLIPAETPHRVTFFNVNAVTNEDLSAVNAAQVAPVQLIEPRRVGRVLLKHWDRFPCQLVGQATLLSHGSTWTGSLPRALRTRGGTGDLSEHRPICAPSA
jgi:hypothetical protein